MLLLENAEARILQALPIDRAPLERLLRAIRRAEQRGEPFDRNLARFQQWLAESTGHYAARQLHTVRPTFDNDLPVTARREELAQAIRDHQVVVVCGETGSGKSTQLPKICLEAGRGREGIIGHTQPRRIAARSIAVRIAQELGVSLGEQVGYKVRFTDATNPRTLIKLMTDGILLAESQHDRALLAYDTLIIDEAHERSLNIDFLLGYIKQLLPERPDLKVIITSATIDAQRFAAHFNTQGKPAPIIEVSGRVYPVEVRYRPLPREEGSLEPDWLRGVLDAIDELRQGAAGDMLVFLPTERDIHTVSKALRGRLQGHGWEILPLYARLSATEQNRVFQGHTGRRVVLATNVAESSLTVPGIRYVVDTGTARISRYSSRHKVQRLPIEPVSRASADQRKGRCGRIGPGVCIRLYSEEDYQSRDRFTAPEIQRSNLAAVILQAKSLGLGNLDAFPFLDPPRPEAIRDGYKTLFELGAIDDDQELTDIGRDLARLPVDPRIGRMILAGAEYRCLTEILIIASALEVQDPRDRPLEQQEAADHAHQRFADKESDFLSYLKLWDHIHDLKTALSQNQMRKACREQFLSYNRIREWLEIHRQLLKIAPQAGLHCEPRRDDYQAIHRALLSGLLSSVARRSDQHEYVVAGGLKAWLWPGSGVFDKHPKWVMAAEVVETTRRYLRCVARINPGWIEPEAHHLLERTYSEPHWDPTIHSAMVTERLALYGLTVVKGRRTRLASVDPPLARELLLDQGLARGGYETTAPFLSHNRRLWDELKALEVKSRQPNLLRGPGAIFHFYDQRIPTTVADTTSFERWRRQAEHENSRLLHMQPADLMMPGASRVDPQAFPDSLVVANVALPLVYRFQPGAADDGITVDVPQELFAQVDPRRLEWLVPGLLEEKVVALIRTLPKPIRKLLVPAPDTARAALERMQFGVGSLTAHLASELSRIAGAQITSEMFQLEQLPLHLRIRIRVVDAHGRTLAVSRDIHELRRQLRSQAETEFDEIRHEQFCRQGIKSWDFGTLPEQVAIDRHGIQLPGYPTLVDRGDSVSLELCASPDAANYHLPRGIRRLFVIAAHSALKQQVEWLPNLKQIELIATALPRDNRGKPGEELPARTRVRSGLIGLIAERAFLPAGVLPRTAEEFDAALQTGRERLGVAVQEVVDLAGRLFDQYHQARLAWETIRHPRWKYASDDIDSQLRHLLAGDFLSSTPWVWLMQFPRYLQAIVVRLDRLRSGAGTADWQAFSEQFEPRWQEYLEASRDDRQEGRFDPHLQQYRWMLEEFRVSLFAQKLGTVVPVSAKRLDRLWSEIAR